MSVVKACPIPNTHSMRITIPAHLARVIPAEALFEPEFTDDGILFRFAGIGAKPEDRGTATPPAWAKGGES